MEDDFYANYLAHLEKVLNTKPELGKNDEDKPLLNYKGMLFAILRSKRGEEFTTKEMAHLLTIRVKMETGTLIHFKSRFISSKLNTLVKEGRAKKRKVGNLNRYSME